VTAPRERVSFQIFSNDMTESSRRDVGGPQVVEKRPSQEETRPSESASHGVLLTSKLGRLV